MESSCPADAVFGDLLDGRLPTAEQQALHAHIEQCSACFALLQALARTAKPSQEEPEAPALPGEYRLIRPLGRGAMGQVYLAEDRQLRRLVAVKFLTAPRPDAAARARFLTEARAVARLVHANVATIYHIGEAAGQPFLVSEYVPGRTLRELDKPLRWPDALALAVGLSRGLAAAHQAGVLHRDLKPANAILGKDGEVKLLDFGLAKLLAASAPPDLPDREVAPSQVSPAGVAQTQHGAVLGTPLYLAPELWSGGAASPASDVYALGAVLYELLVGHPPLQADSLAELARRSREESASPLWLAAAAVPRALSEVVDRCLRRDAAARFASGEELRQALESLLRAAQAAPEGTRAVHERLEAAAAEWARLGMPDAALWSATQLREAEDSAALTPLGEAFLRRSRHAQIVRSRGRWAGALLLLAVPAALWLLLAETQRGSERIQVQAAARRLEQGLQATVLLQRPGQEVAALLLATEAVAESQALGMAPPEPALRALGAALAAAQRSRPLARPPGPGEAALAGRAAAVRVLGAQAEAVSVARLSADGARLATVDRDSRLRLWDAATGRAVATLLGHRQRVRALAFTSAGRGGAALLVSGGEDGVLLWDGRAAGEAAPLAALTAGAVADLAFAPADDALLAAAGADGVARLFALRPPRRPWVSGGLSPLSLDSRGGPLRALVFSPDGQALLTTGQDDSARIWELGPRSEDGLPALQPMTQAHVGAVRALAVVGELVISGGEDGAARLWDARTLAARAALLGHGAAVTAVAACRQRGVTFVVTGSEDGSARLWDAARGDAVAVLRTSGAAVYAVAARCDGDVQGPLLLTASADGDAHLWRGAQHRRRLRGHVGPVLAAVLTPDGELAATGGRDGTVRLWRVRDEHVDTLGGAPREPAGPVTALAFAPDGQTLFSAGADGSARRWQVDTQEPIAILLGHAAPLRALALAPDGLRLLTISDDHSARLVAVRPGPALAIITGAWRSGALSADGQWALLGDADGTLRAVSAPRLPEVSVAAACALLRQQPGITMAERACPLK